MYFTGQIFKTTRYNLKILAVFVMALPGVAGAACIIDGTTIPDCHIVEPDGAPTSTRSHTVRMTTDSLGEEGGGGVAEKLKISGAICGHEATLEKVAFHISRMKTVEIDIKHRLGLGERFESIMENDAYRYLVKEARIWREKDDFDQPFPVPDTNLRSYDTVIAQDNAVSRAHDYSMGYTNYRKNPYARFVPTYSDVAAREFQAKNIARYPLYTFAYPPKWTSETDLVLQGCLTASDWDQMNARLIETADTFMDQIDCWSKTPGESP